MKILEKYISTSLSLKPLTNLLPFVEVEIVNGNKWPLVPNFSQTHGKQKFWDDALPTTECVYGIWWKDELIYIGRTGVNLNNRLSRFIAALMNTQGPDDGHSAAEYFRRIIINNYGKEYLKSRSKLWHELKFSFCELRKEIPYEIYKNYLDANYVDSIIEEELIRKFEPRYNSKAWDRKTFKSKVA